jgi:hypothetical protein
MITAEDIAKVRRYGGGTKEMIADYGIASQGQKHVQVNVDLLVDAISRVLATSLAPFSLPVPFPWTCLPPIAPITSHESIYVRKRL